LRHAKPLQDAADLERISMNPLRILTLLLICLGGLAAQEQLTVYSARHYGGDADLFAAFERASGIKVQVLEAKSGALIERIQREAANCPADVLLTVDAAMLGAADAAGVFQALRSPALEAAIPTHLRHPEGHWFGFGKRFRVIAYAPERVDPATIRNYQDLAGPAFAGRIVVRSSGNEYNQSLLAALIERHGAEQAQAWAAGVLANLARPPQGNDRSQIKAVAAGEADLAIVNHYYYAGMLTSADAEEAAAAKAVKLHFPGQGENGSGAHVNISGAGLLVHAPNPAGGRAFLEFLASEEGQRLFVAPSWEFPAVPSVTVVYPMFPASIKEDLVPADRLAAHNATAVRIFDLVGWR
jgi:iron(III) transport system substrate-binding protein